MSLQVTVKETEKRLSKIYSLKIRKYLSIIYLSIGLYFPIVYTLTVFHFNSFILNIVETSIFLFIVGFCIYLDVKLSKAFTILRKLRNVTHTKNKDKYSFSFSSIAFLVITIITALFIRSYLQYVIPFAFLEYYLFNLFFYQRVHANVEDWIVIVSTISLIFIPLDQLFLSILFSVSWITAGIISLVRLYE